MDSARRRSRGTRGGIYTTTATAAPIPGAHYSRYTVDYADYLAIYVKGSYGDGLTSLGCPFTPHEASIEAQTAHFTLRTQGWYGPRIDTSEGQVQQVRVRAYFTGTVEDGDGNTYKLTGNFLDNGFLPFSEDLMFEGPGNVTLSGPKGTVTGTAEFRLIQAPMEVNFAFTSIKSCNLTP